MVHSQKLLHSIWRGWKTRNRWTVHFSKIKRSVIMNDQLKTIVDLISLRHGIPGSKIMDSGRRISNLAITGNASLIFTILGNDPRRRPLVRLLRCPRASTRHPDTGFAATPGGQPRGTRKGFNVKGRWYFKKMLKTKECLSCWFLKTGILPFRPYFRRWRL